MKLNCPRFEPKHLVSFGTTAEAPRFSHAEFLNLALEDSKLNE